MVKSYYVLHFQTIESEKFWAETEKWNSKNQKLSRNKWPQKEKS